MNKKTIKIIVLGIMIGIVSYASIQREQERIDREAIEASEYLLSKLLKRR